ncbi:enoyl-CoA hydratase/isomerase family protein [Nonomuraea sp. NBC_00507]|uniref:enoyl-CoA hydratase/isomerase family protein n=1 Tax=Nonomuraea sp. NBC_00507 TaxID=2976002 RepID=UPI002E19B416
MVKGEGLILDSSRPGVLRLRLDRGRRRNALVPGLVARLRDAFRTAGERVVILDSADPAVFCAGADLDLPDQVRAELSDELYALYEQMAAHPRPVIAVVEGPAVGGGAQLALVADLRVGGPGARFRFPGVGHGLAVGAWGLPALVGAGRAMDLCLTMRWVAADEAARIGLLTRLSDTPGDEALALADELLRCDRDAIRRVKAAIRDPALFDRLAAERAGNRRAWDGSVAFLQQERGAARG